MLLGHDIISKFRLDRHSEFLDNSERYLNDIFRAKCKKLKVLENEIWLLCCTDISFG